MVRPDNIKLPNLSIAHKFLATFLLIASTGFFLASWLVVLRAVFGPEMPGAALGERLAALYDTNRLAYDGLFALHAATLVALALTTYRLFRLTSFNRRIRILFYLTVVALSVLDLLAWFLVPRSGESNLYVGTVGAAAGIPLVLLSLVPIFQMWIYRRWASPDGQVKRVVIVGGGFAGLYAAMGLNRSLGYSRQLEITLIDRRNYFLFPPLLPSAAAGTIETRQVSFPFRRIFEMTNISFRKMSVTSVDPKAQVVRGLVEVNEDPVTRQLIGREAEFRYDYLVFAPGSTNQTFNTKGASEHAFFMRELNDAVRLRNQVISCFERAAVIDDREAQRELLTFVVVGAGPTGVETATEIFDLIEYVLQRRYPEVDRSLAQVMVVQSGNQVLPGWDESIVRMTDAQLRKMGLAVRLGGRVSEVGPNYVRIGEDTIRARTVVWCAGVRPSELARKSGLPLDASGRVEVDSDCRAKGFSNVFVLGDVARFVDPRTGKELPPLGQVAFQQGPHAAKNLVRLLSGKDTLPFRYFNFGGLVSVGEHFAAVNLLGVKISGFVGWFIWRTLYLSKLVGFSNKIRVVLDWTLDLLVERSISQIRDEEVPVLEAVPTKEAQSGR
jgi:NADH dehydrogenase